MPDIKNELGMSSEELVSLIEGIGSGDQNAWESFLKLGSNGQKILQKMLEDRVEVLPEGSLEKKTSEEALEKIEMGAAI